MLTLALLCSILPTRRLGRHTTVFSTGRFDTATYRHSRTATVRMRMDIFKIYDFVAHTTWPVSLVQRL